MRVHCVHAICVRPRAHAAGHGFVVGKLCAAARIDAANRQVVHRSLARGWDFVWQSFAQCFEQHVNNALRSFDVAARNRSRMRCVDHRALWSDDFNWRHEAGAGGHVTRKQTAKDIRHSGNCDRFDRVDWPGDLR